MRSPMIRSGSALLLSAGLAACGGGGGSSGTPAPNPPVPNPPADQFLALTEVAQVSNAVQLIAPAGDPRQFIVDRSGRIVVRDNGQLAGTPFLDIAARVNAAGEGGLLSMAFDPQFSSNRYVYIVYTDTQNRITVERYTVGANPNVLDPGSALTILRIPHPDFNNHYGGMLAFGPDGHLYLSTGDGGGAGDPRRNSQNRDALLGKLLRIDVRSASLAQPYQIPPNNPFVGQSGARGEIWALGLRNPWRFSFDGNWLYLPDVGQGQREEVNITPASSAGTNYGWNVMEGSACYLATSCSPAGLTLPLYEYEHGPNQVNGCSITGGEVYRGSRIPHLVGSFMFSDYCAGFLKSLRYAGSGVPAVTTWSVRSIGRVVSFGRDGVGEMYVISATGAIYRIDSSATPTGA